MDKLFFDTVRPLFKSLKQHQVDGMKNIIGYARDNNVSRVHLAYMLATTYHESAAWMQPIREGARRYGPSYTDRSARNAVAVIFAKGIIRRNYALPDSNGNSFYGRGLVQITWKANYVKLGKAIGVDLANNPDLTLKWEYALPCLYIGMRDGLYTGKSLDMITEENHNYYEARAMINSDKRKNGKKIADQAELFYDALANYDQMENAHETRNIEGTWPPSWWPFRTD